MLIDLTVLTIIEGFLLALYLMINFIVNVPTIVIIKVIAIIIIFIVRIIIIINVVRTFAEIIKLSVIVVIKTINKCLTAYLVIGIVK